MMANRIDTMDYMGTWMDRVLELELQTEEYHEDVPANEETIAKRIKFEEEFLGSVED